MNTMADTHDMEQTNLIAVGSNALKSFLEHKGDELMKLGIHVIFIDTDDEDANDDVLDELIAVQNQRNILFAFLNSWKVKKDIGAVMCMWGVDEGTPADDVSNLRYVFMLPFNFEDYSMKTVYEVRQLCRNLKGSYIDCEERMQKSLEMPLLDFINDLYDEIFNQILKSS